MSENGNGHRTPRSVSGLIRQKQFEEAGKRLYVEVEEVVRGEDGEIVMVDGKPRTEINYYGWFDCTFIENSRYAARLRDLQAKEKQARGLGLFDSLPAEIFQRLRMEAMVGTWVVAFGDAVEDGPDGQPQPIAYTYQDGSVHQENLLKLLELKPIREAIELFVGDAEKHNLARHEALEKKRQASSPGT